MTQELNAGTFAPYNAHLSKLVSEVYGGRPEVQSRHLGPSLDGECAAQVRKLVPLRYRREVGAFFTSGPHRDVVASVLADLPAGPYLDPACGGGDLLLAASRNLPIAGNVADTVSLWSSQLAGWDLHREFTKATRLRLLLAAAARHLESGTATKNTLPRQPFPRVATADANIRLRPASLRDSVIVLNPPFGIVDVPKSCTWAEGSTSRAAFFVESVLEAVERDCHLVAILPDVLRTGSNYRHWRKMVELRCDVKMVEPLGMFDQHTDIDVFLMTARVGGLSRRTIVDSQFRWWSPPLSEGTRTVGDVFDVRVGSVVDNRDLHEGDWRPFITARDLPKSGAVASVNRSRRFSKRLFVPPFVVVRRTSRPTLRNGEVRSPGVLILGDDPIAVDNHLIVLVPRNGAAATCEELLIQLSSEATTTFLDERMRCRHLTVEAVRELRWTSEKEPAL